MKKEQDQKTQIDNEVIEEIRKMLSNISERINIIEENQQVIESKIDYILRYGKGL